MLNFENLGGMIGIPGDQMRMLVGFLLCVPIGFGFQRIKGRNLRINLGTILGLLLTYMVYQKMIISVLIQTFIVYIMVKNLGKKCAFPVFIETICYLSLHHIYRQIYDYGGWSMDVSVILMMNTCKWTSFAWNVVDGLRKEEELTEDQKLRRINKLPSFQEYFGYIFFYAGCIAGPSYDYYEYDEFMDKKGVYAQLPSQKVIGLETLRLLRNAFIFSVILIISLKYFSIEYFFTEEFAKSSFLVKTFWINIIITLHRSKYWSGWTFSEASIASSGFTYNGKNVNTNQHQFERIQSINPQFEITQNFQDKVKFWNVSCQKWLSRYVYLRVHKPSELRTDVKKQKSAQMVTYLVSAIWHGFYPGYYVSFIQYAIYLMNVKYCYNTSKNNKKFKIFELNKFAWFIRFYWSNTVFNAIGGGFILLSLERNLIFFNNLYQIPNLTNFLMFVFFTSSLFKQTKKQNEVPKSKQDL